LLIPVLLLKALQAYLYHQMQQIRCHKCPCNRVWIL